MSDQIELRQEYTHVMGAELGDLYYDLMGELHWLRYKWGEFKELFDKGPERINLLNTAASNFFYILKKLSLEDAMLHLCRLTDPPETRVKKSSLQNLTIMRLPEAIANPELKDLVEKTASEARSSCGFARQWRDKKLAHIDLLIHQRGWALSLPPVDARRIDGAIDSLRATLDLVGKHYGRSPSDQMPSSWGAKSLVRYLEKSVRMEEQGED